MSAYRHTQCMSAQLGTRMYTGCNCIYMAYAENITVPFVLNSQVIIESVDSISRDEPGSP